MIHEKAKDTAAKVRQVLKKQFQGVKFSVTSDTRSMSSSVCIHWQDGPLESDVEQAIGWMASARFDGMQDMRITTGYLWEGERYNGADFIEVCRTESDERAALVRTHLQQTREPYQQPDYYRPIDREAAERELIQAGMLKGFPLAIPGIRQPDPQPVIPPAGKLAEVIPFATFQEKGAARLTPEQWFKYELLQSLEPFIKALGQHLDEDGEVIDELFKVVANRIYGIK